MINLIDRFGFSCRGSEQIRLNCVRDEYEVAAGIAVPIQKNRFAVYQCCDPLWNDSSVIPFWILARSKNIEVPKTDGFESIRMGKDVRIEFARILRCRIRRERPTNRAFCF